MRHAIPQLSDRKTVRCKLEDLVCIELWAGTAETEMPRTPNGLASVPLLHDEQNLIGALQQLIKSHNIK